MAEIGYISLLLALIASLYSAATFAFGRSAATARSAAGSLLTVFGLVSLSVLVMLIALLSHNFRLEYVASYTSRDTSLAYLISALWAGSSGSLLVWAWLLSLCSLVAFRVRRRSGDLVPQAAAVTMLCQAFFLLLLVTVSNPFRSLPYAPADGSGMNPMLENPGMIFHPPTLLAGYISLTIPFAFAVAALLAGRFSEGWLDTMRRWMLVAWLLLGIGLLIGAWWAYVELGWGGYWAWDPVENAGLMPWLVVTAFLHSIMMQRRRGIFKAWNMVLVILAFVLAVFGTFLTRSGIVSSVHTFSESALVPFFVVFLSLSLLGSLFLVYYRGDMLRSEVEIESLLSRESASLVNNLLFVGCAMIVLVGTMFPMLSEVALGGRANLGASFFNEVGVPVFLAIILLIGGCALFGWRKSAVRDVARQSIVPLLGALAAGLFFFGVAGVREWYVLLAAIVLAFVLLAIGSRWWREVSERHRGTSEGYFRSFWSLLLANKPRYGGYLVHLSIVLIALGVTGSSVYSVEKEAVLSPGQSMTIKAYTLTYENVENSTTPSKTIIAAAMSVSRDGKKLGTLTPEKYYHRSYEQPVSEVAIRTSIGEDLYVILVGPDGKGNMAFRVLVNPLVDWIWIGGGVLMLGGLIAFMPERRKKTVPVKGKAPARVEDEIEKQVAALRKKKSRV